MEKLYKFKSNGKSLFIIAGVICVISFVGIPFGLMFFYMASTSKIIMKDDHMIYKMLTTKNIPYKQITKIRLAKPVSSNYYIGHGAPVFVNFATVIPLIIEWNGKKTKLSANFFENAEEITRTLEAKTGLTLEVEKA
ncbi:hypothetical protein KBC97_02550 [Candidatus Gracilibacteria bacterium]|nr:hypothetical protein [Candidatus Gracilibacteria bacterium]